MIPDPMTWKEIDSLKCRCGQSELEQVEGMAHTLRCKTCRGWWSMQLSVASDMEKVRAEFGEPRL
jgi:hypothetical protein